MRLVVNNMAGTVQVISLDENNVILLKIHNVNKKNPQIMPLTYLEARELALALNHANIIDDLKELLAKYKGDK